MKRLVCLLALELAAHSLPQVEGESLAGRKLVLPDALQGQQAVIVWSFTREAGEQVERWAAPLVRDRINVYSAAVIEAAPRLVRPMIRASMRRASPEPFHDRFFCITRGEKALRQWLEVRNDKLPYVTVIDGQGGVVWKYAGPYSEAAAAELKRKLEEAR